MIINHRLEFVFLGVPRTASYSMEAALRGLPGSTFHGKHRFRVPAYAEHYFKFCCVRNPYAREWSHFKYRRSNRNNKMYSWARRWSFAQYIRWTVDPALPPVKYHDPPMSDMLRGIDLDYVMRYENLPQDWRRLPEVSKIPALSLRLPRLRTTPNKDFRRQYDQRLADMVYEWAHEDFEQFGYDKNSWRE